MGAYATDFVEKIWPLTYRPGRRQEDRLPVRGQLRHHRPAGRRLPLGPLRRGRRQLPQLRRMGRPNGKTATDPANRPTVKALRRPHRPATSAASTSIIPTRSGPTASSPNCSGSRRTASCRGCRSSASATITPSGTRRRQADADGDGRRQRPGPGPGRRGRLEEQVLEGDGHLRDRGRRPERPRPRRCPPHRGPGRIALHQARLRRFDDVFDDQHVADDGTDPRPQADEPVRRRRPADVRELPADSRTPGPTRPGRRRWT